MDTLLLTSVQPFSVDELANALVPSFVVARTADGGLVVDDSRSRVYLRSVDREATNGSRQLYVDYSDVELVKRVVSLIADSPSITIDNEVGPLLRGDEFVARCRGEMGWNWRMKSNRKGSP